MYLKPIKTLGRQYQAKIYKHYVETRTQVLLSPELTQNETVVIKYDEIYFVKNDVLAYGGFALDLGTLYAPNIALRNINIYKRLGTKYTAITLETLEKDYVNYFISPRNDKIYKFTIPVSTQTLSVEEVKTISFNKIGSILQAPTKSSKFESNKYYYLETFNYMPIDDIEDTKTSHIRGHIVNEETRSIRFDIDNVPLEVNDIIELENGSYYAVQDILTKQRIGMYAHKTYIATLYKVGV